MTVAAAQLEGWANAARDALAHRDECIRDMRAEGASLRQIAAVAGLSPAGVAKILAR